MAGQTQREGPWESNLGLEPEWDGASGLWWPVECDQLPERAKEIPFYGSIAHHNYYCSIKLYTQLTISLIKEGSFSSEPEFIYPSLWHAHLELPDEEGKIKTTPVTVSAFLIGRGFQGTRQATSLMSLRLRPLWIIKGAHIDSLRECMFDNMILKTDSLRGLLPNILPVYRFLKQDSRENMFDYDNIDLKAFEEANTINLEAKLVNSVGENIVTLDSKFQKSFGNKISSEIDDLVQFSFPKPIPIMNYKMREATPLSCLWDWSDWLVGLFEMISNTPTSSVIINATTKKKAFIRIYIKLNLARKEHSIDEIANKIRLDPVDDQENETRWNSLLKTWFEIWNLESNWFVAIDYLRQVLRQTDINLMSIETYFLHAVRVLEARWFAEHGELNMSTNKPFTTEEIVQSTLNRADIISIELERAVGKNFNTGTLSQLIACIRNEFTHPATKDKRIKLRELLKKTDNENVEFLSLLLIAAALKLIKQEMLRKYIAPNEFPRNRYIEKYDERFRLKLGNWKQLKRACSV